MAAIPNHIMQGVALSSHLCEKLDKVNKDFLWGSSMERRKLHLVGWSKIIRPQNEGALDIQETGAKNIALLAKLNWRLYQDKDSMWAKVLLSKYYSQHRRNSLDPNKLPCSSNWAAIKVRFPIFKQGICLNVENKSNLSFWESNWVKGNAMIELIKGLLAQHKETQTISKIHQNEYWNLDKISFDLPRVVVD